MKLVLNSLIDPRVEKFGLIVKGWIFCVKQSFSLKIRFISLLKVSIQYVLEEWHFH